MNRTEKATKTPKQAQHERALAEIERLLEKPLSQANVAVIREFLAEKESLGVLPTSRLQYTKTLVKVAATLFTPRSKRTLKELTKTDLTTFINTMQPRHATATVNNFKGHILNFLGWLESPLLKNEKVQEQLKRKRSGLKKIQAADLLTDQEIALLISAAQIERDRALLAILAETGARVSEVLGLQFKHVLPDPDGIILTMPNEKWERGDWEHGNPNTRPIWIQAAVPYLRDWIKHHPFGGVNNQERYLFCQTNNDPTVPITRQRVGQIVRKAARQVGIPKKVYPHLFRHTKATEDAKYLSEAILRKKYNWSPVSTMPAFYVHLASTDSIERQKAAAGIITNNQAPITKQPLIPCPACERENPPNYKYCIFCNAILDPERARAEREIAEVLDLFYQLGPDGLQDLTTAVRQLIAKKRG